MPVQKRTQRGAKPRCVATRAKLAAALEVDSHVCDGALPGQGLGFPQQCFARLEVAAETLDASQLRQDFGTTRVCTFPPELGAEALLGSGQIVEVPQWPQAIRHAATVRTGELACIGAAAIRDVDQRQEASFSRPFP